MKKINLVLTILVLVCLSNSVFADSLGIQTLTLNTGFNHATNSKYPSPGTYPSTADPRDEYWVLLSDTSTTGNILPRSSSIMPKYYSAWLNPLTDSEWIAFFKNGVPTNNGKHYREYVFGKCFCIKKGALRSKENLENAKLEVNFRSDDYGAVYLNQSLANITSQTIPNPYSPIYTSTTPAPFSILNSSSTQGGFNITPASKVIKGEELVKMLKEGRNCLQFKLLDLALVVSGFNLSGSLNLSGIEEVAKFNEKTKRPEFSQCSSCANKKVFDDSKVFDFAGQK